MKHERAALNLAAPDHFATTLSSTPEVPPPFGTDDDLLVELGAEVDVDIQRRVEEALDIPVVQGLDAEDVRAGIRPAMTKLPSSLSEKPPTSVCVCMSKATTCAPSTPFPLLVTLPLMLPVSCV